MTPHDKPHTNGGPADPFGTESVSPKNKPHQTESVPPQINSGDPDQVSPSDIFEQDDSYLSEEEASQQTILSDKNPIPLARKGSGSPGPSPSASPGSHLKKKNLAPEPSGNRLGQYEILSELGRGGMGVVYRGFQSTLHRYVGLKVLPEHLAANKDLVARFQVEARAAARLTHPHITGIYEIGEDNGTHYFAMEYVEGKTLADLITEHEQLPFMDAINYVIQSADALAYAHKKGVIHRDIKPSNIMLTSEGLIKVMDFGLARIEDDDQRLTMSGMTLGTPAYMSPEQAGADDLGPLDHRADLYSLGVVLYELVTGKLPHDGKSKLEILRKIIDVPPVAPSTFREEISPDLEDIILKALKKPVADRFQTAADFRDALKGLDELSPTTTLDGLQADPGPSKDPAKPRSTGSQTIPASANKRIPILIGAGFVICILAVIGLSSFWSSKQSAGAANLTATGESALLRSALNALSSNQLDNAESLIREAAADITASTSPESRDSLLTLQSRLEKERLVQAQKAYESGSWRGVYEASLKSIYPVDAEETQAIQQLERSFSPLLRGAYPGQANDAVWTTEDTANLLREVSQVLAQNSLDKFDAIYTYASAIYDDPTPFVQAYLVQVGREASGIQQYDLAAAIYLSLAETAPNQKLFAAAMKDLLAVSFQQGWSGAKFGLLVFPLREKLPPGDIYRPIQRSLAWWVAAARDNMVVIEDEQVLEPMLAELWAMEDAATALEIIPPAIPTQLSPSRTPPGRYNKIEGSIVADSSELLSYPTTGLLRIRAYSFRQQTPRAEIPQNTRLPYQWAGRLELGDGGAEYQRAFAVLSNTDRPTEDSPQLLLIDLDGNGHLTDDWPITTRYAANPRLAVGGKFDVAHADQFRFKIDFANRALLVANVGALTGRVNLGGEMLEYFLVDTDGDGLYDDFDAETESPGAMATLKLRDQEFPLAKDVAYQASGGNHFMLADLTTIGTQTYWKPLETTRKKIAFTLSQPERAPTPNIQQGNAEPPAPPAPRVLAVLGNAAQEQQASAGSNNVVIELPNGTLDMYFYANGYRPQRRYLTIDPDKGDEPMRILLKPMGATELTPASAIISRNDAERGAPFSLLDAERLTLLGNNDFCEIAIRRQNGKVEVAVLLPRTSLTGAGGTRLNQPLTFQPPKNLNYVEVATGQPLTLIPLEGKLGYKVDFQLNLKADGQALEVQRTIIPLAPSN